MPATQLQQADEEHDLQDGGERRRKEPRSLSEGVAESPTDLACEREINTCFLVALGASLLQQPDLCLNQFKQLIQLVPHIRTFKLQAFKDANVHSGVSDTAACPPSPIADDPSALPSPTSSPHSSQ